MRTWLLSAGLLFSDPKDEDRFWAWFVLEHRRYTQGALVLGGVLLYAFFIWDRIIDPANADTAHAVRGGLLLATLAVSALLSISAAHNHLEAISTFIAITVAIGLAFISYILTNGFDYGVVGAVFLIFFSVAMVRLRISYFVTICIATWASFSTMQAFAEHGRPGMIIVNNMTIGAAAFVGCVAATLREQAGRREFKIAAELDASKQRIEELLHSMLPKEIVARIQEGATTIADAYAEASIIFADLVGFTGLSRRMSPTQLLELLTALFSRFDTMAERYGIEKIKTIGDAYMAVGGLSPGASGSDHVERAAGFALALQRIVSEVSAEMGCPLNIRVGLHVGPIVAGVIGTKRPAFDCWGEAVNIASRLENTANPGAVVISEAAYWRLRGAFEVQVLSKVDLKGIGPSQVFLLLPARPEPSRGAVREDHGPGR